MEKPKNLRGYDNLPEAVSSQIDAVVNIWKKHLGVRLEGVYLHGSIPLGAFNPDSGDIDMLIVVNEPLTVQEKLDIAGEIIAIDKSPCPLEMSAGQRSVNFCSQCKYITPFFACNPTVSLSWVEFPVEFVYID